MQSHGRRILAANLNALECCFLFVRWIVSANEANADLTHSGWSSPWFGSGAIVIVTPALRKKFLERTAHSWRLEITWAQQHFSTVYLNNTTSQQYYNILSSLEKKLFYVLCSRTNQKKLIILICEPRPPNWTSTVQAGSKMMSTTQGGSPVNIALQSHWFKKALSICH